MKWFWLSLVREKSEQEREFAGVLIDLLPAEDTATAAREAQKRGLVPGGVLCKGGPLLDSIIPPIEYTGRLLDEAEAREAKAALDEMARGSL